MQTPSPLHSEVRFFADDSFLERGALGPSQGLNASLGVKALFIEPGSPWENGYNESFNGKLRDELLNGGIFYTLEEAKVLIEQWRRHYNTIRPHSAFGYRPPAPLFDRDKIIVLRDFIPYEPDHMTIHATHVEGQIFRTLEEAVGFLSSSCFDDVLGEPEAVQARTKPKACEFWKRRTS